MRTVLAGVGLSLIAIAAFSFTPIGANVASVIEASDSRGAACLAEIMKLNGSATAITADITRADFNDDGTDDRVIRLTDDTSCGTNGCITEICLAKNTGVELLPFGYATNALHVLETRSNGYYDITINENVTLSWDGTHYTPTE
jgi:hypothetical protein